MVPTGLPSRPSRADFHGQLDDGPQRFQRYLGLQPLEIAGSQPTEVFGQRQHGN